MDADPPNDEILNEAIASGGYYYNGTASASFCGGSLIAPDLVLSAAHCSGRVKKVRVGVHNATWDTEYGNGGNNPNSTLDDDDGELLSVIRVVKHPQYLDTGINGFDVMVMKLGNRSSSTPVRLNDDPNVPLFHDPSTTPPGSLPFLRLIGFGRQDVNVRNTSLGVLQVGGGYMVGFNECRRIYGGILRTGMLCVNYTEGSQCKGDSGSPVVLEGPDGDVQVGVVSFSINCAVTVPGVLARVSAHFEWIAQQVCLLSDDPPLYFDCPTRLASIVNAGNNSNHFNGEGAAEPPIALRNGMTVDLRTTGTKPTTGTPTSGALERQDGNNGDDDCPTVSITAIAEADRYAHETGFEFLTFDHNHTSYRVRAELPPFSSRTGVDDFINTTLLLHDLDSFQDF